MKKKYLLLTFLALAIITSLTAGTLAVYTSTADLTSGAVAAKKFAFAAAGNENFDNPVKIAPTESAEYFFIVTNKDAGAICEVDLDYGVSLDFAKALSAMPGLKATLYQKEGTSWTQVSTSVNGALAVTKIRLAKDVEAIHNYRLVLTWVDDGNSDAEQTSSGIAAIATTFKITVNATQAI